MKKIISFFGTRPEAIKIASVAQEFTNLGNDRIVHRLCDTGQHREMVRPLVAWFGLNPDFSLDLMTENQSLAGFTARAIIEIDCLLRAQKPDLVLCQGDTTTAMVVGLTAFYLRIPVGHVEAGLRTHNRDAPFPEEVNRKIIDLVADYCFAPTQRAAEELHREMMLPPESIAITGNTAIDALFWSLAKLSRDRNRPLSFPQEIQEAVSPESKRRWVIVTAHRRESFGRGMQEIAQAIRQLADYDPDLMWIFPVHPNPKVKGIMMERLGKVRNIYLVPPIDYPQFCWLIQKSQFVLTDSGGLQEECPSLGIPVFLMRDTSERPEGIEAGNVKLVGTLADGIVAAIRCFFDNSELQRRMGTPRNLYGDGTAAKQIVEYCVRAVESSGAVSVSPNKHYLRKNF
jgi:UDP-N-acetylglucosamine 2-epimerase (non-hydrolysing)